MTVIASRAKQSGQRSSSATIRDFPGGPKGPPGRLYRQQHGGKVAPVTPLTSGLDFY